MVEFLLLVLPLITLAGSTVAVSWYAFAKTQLKQIVSESAFQLAQPDSTEAEVFESASTKLQERLGVEVIRFASSQESSVAEVAIGFDLAENLGLLALVLPPLSEVGHAQTEL